MTRRAAWMPHAAQSCALSDCPSADARNSAAQNRSLLLRVASSMPAGVALAETPFAHPSDLPKVSCDAIHYSDAHLRRDAMAPAACVDGRMLNGEKWASFDTRLYLIDYPKFITGEMLDASGNPV